MTEAFNTAGKMDAPLFQAIRNFRDCGGYRTQEGGKVRTGVLYRSAHFPNASDTDLATLEALGASVVGDLRRPGERQSHPCRRWPGFERTRLIEHDGVPGADLPPHLAAFVQAGESAEAADFAMREIYRGMPFDAMIRELFRDFLTALAESDGALLVHCAAGKDRTGVAAALAQHIAGVSRDDIFAHYLETNRTALSDPSIIENVRENFGRDGRVVCDEAIHVILSVTPDYLTIALAEMTARYGSIDGYLRDGLGVTPALRRAVAQRMTG